MLSKNNIFNFSIVSFIIAVLVNNYLQDFLLSIYVLIFICFILINLVLYKKTIKKFLILFIFILIGYFLGVIISSINLDNIQDNTIFLEKNYVVSYNYEFEILELYKKDDYYNSYVVKLKSISGDIVDKNINGIVYFSSNFMFEKGTVFSTNSRILSIDKVDKFDYKSYLLSKNIYFKIYIYNHEVIYKKINILTILDKFREQILNIINKIYPQEQAILLSGILLGARENIGKDLSEDFNNSGTTHFIAVSGANISILIIFLGFLLKFIPVYLRFFLIISFIVIFCLFVGLGASVIRAGIIGILSYIVMISGRSHASVSLLFLASFLMIIYNPFFVSYDLSFQLSFLAVLGILFLKDLFDKVFYFLPDFLAIKDSFSITMSALIFTIPITMFNFGQFSLLSPFSNIAFAWTVPIIMLLGFLSIIFFSVNTFAGLVFGFITYIFLKWDIEIIHFFGNLEQFIIRKDFGDYSIYFEVVYLIALIFLLILLNQKKIKKSTQ